MDGFFKGLVDKAPDIIGKAGQGPVALAALVFLIFGALGAFLFRDATGEQKLLAFAMFAACFLGVLVLVVVFEKARGKQVAPKLAEEERQYVVGLYGRTERYFGGQNDQAHAAYGDASAISMRADNRIEKANGLAQRGEVLRALGRNDQAREDYLNALELYKQVDNRFAQASVLFGLGLLLARENPQQAAAYFDKAAQSYEVIGMAQDRDAALHEADKLSKG